MNYEYMDNNLVEPQIMYNLQKSLQKCKNNRIAYYSSVFNWILFGLICMFILYVIYSINNYSKNNTQNSEKILNTIDEYNQNKYELYNTFNN